MALQTHLLTPFLYAIAGERLSSTRVKRYANVLRWNLILEGMEIPET